MARALRADLVCPSLLPAMRIVALRARGSPFIPRLTFP